MNKETGGARKAARTRIPWIDVAKGGGMLLVILGHTLPYESILRRFIFSFHMPLFFVLSGYTAGKVGSWPAYWRHLKKNFTALLLPCFLLVEGFNVLLNYYLSAEKGLAVLGEIARYNLQTLFWASGNAREGIPSVGMPWFLFAMFWGKCIWDALGILFPKNNMAAALFVALCGFFVGRIWYLPQCLDVAMAVCLYMSLGRFFRQHSETVERVRGVLFLGAFFVWVFLVEQNLFLEFASRSYPSVAGGMLASLCGVFCFCTLCREISANKGICSVLGFFGKHSLWLFFVHHYDIFINFLWGKGTLLATCVCRFACDILIMLALFGIYSAARKLLPKRNA